MIHRVREAYIREFEVAPRARVGEVVTFERLDPKNPAWFFGRDAAQVAGYFPVAWFTITGATATARRDYDAMEISAPAGALATVIERHGQWALVQTADGMRGWIPESHIEPIS